MMSCVLVCRCTFYKTYVYVLQDVCMGHEGVGHACPIVMHVLCCLVIRITPTLGDCDSSSALLAGGLPTRNEERQRKMKICRVLMTFMMAFTCGAFTHACWNENHKKKPSLHPERSLLHFTAESEQEQSSCCVGLAQWKTQRRRRKSRP